MLGREMWTPSFNSQRKEVSCNQKHSIAFWAKMSLAIWEQATAQEWCACISTSTSCTLILSSIKHQIYTHSCMHYWTDYLCLLSLFLPVPHAPGITNIRRLSATKIWVTWNRLSLEESRGFLLSYTVAYNENQIRATCPEVNPEASMKTINSSLGNTQLIISDLNPGLEVCVAIAASTVAGTSDFSKAKKAPCKYHKKATLKTKHSIVIMLMDYLTSLVYFNSQFQLLFSGIHNCNGWAVRYTRS